jgi:hypothetical protein
MLVEIMFGLFAVAVLIAILEVINPSKNKEVPEERNPFPWVGPTIGH